ncbi:MAG: hypothetical protein IPL26_29755 [Leptospiraceae bacterium]|nr:hypothetical protein [Leptospiraceae bacterium]
MTWIKQIQTFDKSNKLSEIIAYESRSTDRRYVSLITVRTQFLFGNYNLG